MFKFKFDLKERSLKSKKCQKCTYFNSDEGCLIKKNKWLNINIKKCKDFGKCETSITGDY